MKVQTVGFEHQIPRASLYWLLLAQFALIVPHMATLPRWLLLVCLGCGIWRIQIYRGRLPYTASWLRAGLAIAALVAVTASYLQRLGMDAIIAFLILIFFLKLLETRRSRDMYVTIFLGYFIAATPVLHDGSMVATAYALLCFLLLSVALLALHGTGNFQPGESLARIGRLLLQGLPVVLVLFVLFPRLGPIWQPPSVDGQQAGVGDSITLGAFRGLAQSDEVSFRVTFDTGVPPDGPLYWRGLVFDVFDGETWRVAPERSIGEGALPVGLQNATQSPVDNYLGPMVDYSVILEPGQGRWLFALPWARSNSPGVIATEHSTLQLAHAPVGRYHYRVSSELSAVRQRELPVPVRERNLALPETGNIRARQLARTLRARQVSDRRLALDVLAMFGQQDYYYTLQPPVAERDSIDHFLFDGMRGYCEHYAAAFVFLMRAAGVPARMVGGYLGGETNPFDSHLAVRQMDAHAWAEVWHTGQGWVRYDPTAAVAPERVLDGADAALMTRNRYQVGGLFGFGAYRDLAWMQSARLWWAAVNYGWTRWVLNYDRDNQRRLLADWVGRADLAALLYALLGALGLVMLGMLLWIVRGAFWPRYTGPQRAAVWCAWVLARLGEKRQPAESMIAYCARIAERYPDLAPTLAEFSACWSALCYAELRYPWLRRMQLYGSLVQMAWQVLRIRLVLPRPAETVK